MSSTTAPESAPPAEKRSRLPQTFRWAARLSSLPMFGLLLISLLPALASFSVSAKDDKMIAIGLCAVAIGFIVGWRWPGIGGLLAIGGVAAIVTQEDGGLEAIDPFSLAFALQGVLFLISSVLVSQGAGPSAPTRNRWLRAGAAALLTVSAIAGAAMILRGPAPVPISRGEEPYVGTWEDGTGFGIQISAEGRAKVWHPKEAKIAPFNSPVPAGSTNDFLVQFRDNRLELSGGVLGESKIYQVDRPPFPQAKQVKMVLNGSDPYKRGSGVILARKEPLQPSDIPPPRLRKAR